MITKMKLTNKATGAVRYEDVHATKVSAFINHTNRIGYDHVRVALGQEGR
jgi:hypothetical protein